MRSWQQGIAALAAVMIGLAGAGCGGDNTTVGLAGRAAPTAAFTVSPTSGDTTTSFLADASASSDATDAASALRVSFDFGDGTTTPLSTTKTASHTYSTIGTKTIRVTVQNTAGLTATTTRTVTVNAPAGRVLTPSFTVAPVSGDTTTSFQVNASASSDTTDAASALQVSYDFGDGTITPFTTTKTASHTYATSGTKTITLTVKNTIGQTATTTHTVTVTAARTAPTASFTATPATGNTTTSFVVDASASTDAADAASALQVSYDFGDGTVTPFSTTKTASHTYSTTGTKTITLTVKNTAGLTSTTTRTVTVAARTAPAASFTVAPTSGDSTTTFVADASGSTDPADAASALQVSFDFGDGTVTPFSTTKTASHQYATSGTKTITLTVRNTAGLTSTTTRTVTVNLPSGPAVSRITPGTYTPGSSVQVTLTVTPPSGTVDYAVEDQLPAGWTASGLDQGGAFDAVNGKVKWGPFFDNTPRTFTYTATAPATATGTQTFVGDVSAATGAGNQTITVIGDRQVSP